MYRRTTTIAALALAALMVAGVASAAVGPLAASPTATTVVEGSDVPATPPTVPPATTAPGPDADVAEVAEEPHPADEGGTHDAAAGEAADPDPAGPTTTFSEGTASRDRAATAEDGASGDDRPGDGLRTVAVPPAGTVVVEAAGGSLRLVEARLGAGWSWEARPSRPGELELVVTDGVVRLEVKAELEHGRMRVEVDGSGSDRDRAEADDRSADAAGERSHEEGTERVPDGVTTHADDVDVAEAPSVDEVADDHGDDRVPSVDEDRSDDDRGEDDAPDHDDVADRDVPDEDDADLGS